MTADKSAAPPVEREKFEAWVSARGANVEHHRHKPDEYATMATQERWTIWSAAVSQASPPIPAGQEVRMLTEDELRAVWLSAEVRPGHIIGLMHETQRKFCEVNAGKTIPKLAPATTEPKP